MPAAVLTKLNEVRKLLASWTGKKLQHNINETWRTDLKIERIKDGSDITVANLLITMYASDRSFPFPSLASEQSNCDKHK
jgi:hypothetical protein